VLTGRAGVTEFDEVPPPVVTAAALRVRARITRTRQTSQPASWFWPASLSGWRPWSDSSPTVLGLLAALAAGLSSRCSPDTRRAGASLLAGVGGRRSRCVRRLDPLLAMTAHGIEAGRRSPHVPLRDVHEIATQRGASVGQRRARPVQRHLHQHGLSGIDVGV
jgi:hypothetical protein